MPPTLLVTSDVVAVREQLSPIRSRRSLAASYGREAFHDPSTGSDARCGEAVRMAYALRWLELGPDRS